MVYHSHMFNIFELRSISPLTEIVYLLEKARSLDDPSSPALSKEVGRILKYLHLLVLLIFKYNLNLTA